MRILTQHNFWGVAHGFVIVMCAACGGTSTNEDDGASLLADPFQPMSSSTSVDDPRRTDGESSVVDAPAGPVSELDQNTGPNPMANVDPDTSATKTDNAETDPENSEGIINGEGLDGEDSMGRTPRRSLDLDLSISSDNLIGFRKTRGSMDPQAEVVFYWSGYIFLDRDEAPDAPPVSEFPGPIMRFEGYNIARFVPEVGAVRMVSREMAVYKDLSGRILNCWNNRPLGLGRAEYVPVVHVFNDPVNHTITGGSANILGDDVTWNLEVMLRYPSPLPIAEYPENSASNTYEASELFNFYAKMSDLNDPDLDTVPVNISWTRVGQFLPWMKAGQTPGKLIYHTYGKKLLGGFDELPEDIKAYVLDVAPEYAQAPATDESPNATSWKVFRRLVQNGQYQGTCP